MSDETLFEMPVEQIHAQRMIGEELEMFHQYKHLVYEMVDRYYRDGFWYDDVLDEGFNGLSAAITGHQPRNAAGFETLARWCIKNRIYKLLSEIVN